MDRWTQVGYLWIRPDIRPLWRDGLFFWAQKGGQAVDSHGDTHVFLARAAMMVVVWQSETSIRHHLGGTARFVRLHPPCVS